MSAPPSAFSGQPGGGEALHQALQAARLVVASLEAAIAAEAQREGAEQRQCNTTPTDRHYALRAWMIERRDGWQPGDAIPTADELWREASEAIPGVSRDAVRDARPPEWQLPRGRRAK
jgi:hypothetical protein